MNEVKPHLSYEGQINKLREKGCIIDDDSFCRNVLDKFQQNIEREIENNKNVLFVKHHIDNYDGQFPI